MLGKRSREGDESNAIDLTDTNNTNTSSSMNHGNGSSNMNLNRPLSLNPVHNPLWDEPIAYVPSLQPIRPHNYTSTSSNPHTVNIVVNSSAKPSLANSVLDDSTESEQSMSDDNSLADIDSVGDNENNNIDITPENDNDNDDADEDEDDAYFERTLKDEREIWSQIPFLYDFFYDFGLDWPFGTACFGPIINYNTTFNNIAKKDLVTNKLVYNNRNDNTSKDASDGIGDYCLQRLYYSQSTDATFHSKSMKYNGTPNVLVVADMPLPNNERQINMAAATIGKE